jgi:hypothetical protein
MIYDSAGDMEARHATHFPQIFNVDSPHGWCPSGGDAEGLLPAPGGDYLKFLASAADPEVAYLSLVPPGTEGAEVPEFVTATYAGARAPSSPR